MGDPLSESCTEPCINTPQLALNNGKVYKNILSCSWYVLKQLGAQFGNMYSIFNHICGLPLFETTDSVIFFYWIHVMYDPYVIIVPLNVSKPFMKVSFFL